MITLSSLRRGLLTPSVICTLFVLCAGNLRPAMGAGNQVGIGLPYRPASLCSLATQFQTRFLESIPRPITGLKIPTLILLRKKWHREQQRAGKGTLEYWPCMPFLFLVMIMWRVYKFYIPAAHISSGSQLNSPSPKQPALARSITNYKSWPPAPLLLLRWARRRSESTLIVCSLYGAQSNSIADELKSIWLTKWLGTHERRPNSLFSVYINPLCHPPSLVSKVSAFLCIAGRAYCRSEGEGGKARKPGPP